MRWLWFSVLFLAVSAVALWLILYQRSPLVADRILVVDAVQPLRSEQPPPPRPLRFGIGTMVTPKSTFQYYSRLAEVLSGAIGTPIVVLQKSGYANTNELLLRGDVDFAFVCSGAYVDLASKMDLFLLAAPQIDGKAIYWSEIIVPVESSTHTLADLARKDGLRLVYVDPLSNTGYLVVRELLRAAGIDPDRPDIVVMWSGSHEESIQLVAHGMADLAGVDVLVLHAMQRAHPDVVNRTRTILRSQPFASPPIVVSKAVPDATRKNLQDALVRLHETEVGRAVLHDLGVEGFLPVNDSDYNAVRKLLHKTLPGGSP